MSKKLFNYVFERTEKKYLLSETRYNKVLKLIQPYMQQDEYGLTTICNIYFDTESNDLIRRSIDKPIYKEKLRLRSYGIPRENDNVFLEIKKKWKSTVYKRRITLSYKEAEDYLYRGILPETKSQIFKEIDYFINFYDPQPKLFLAYDRVAYIGINDSSLRITFDNNIRSRPDDLHLADGDKGVLLDMPEKYLMEIKVSNTMPIWMVRMLSDLEIYPVSFSKYGNVYGKSLLKKIVL